MNQSQAEDLAELQDLAGQYVLGTLSLQRRQQVEQRMLTEVALRDLVDAWEQRLHPLTALAEPQHASSGLWPRIERSLPAPPRVRRAGGWQAWWNNLNFWRWTTAAGLACSALLVAVMLQGGQARRAPGYMVVLVAPRDTVPAWVVQTSSRGQLSLMPLTSASVPEQKALQFWTKGQDWAGPVSLGLVKPGRAQSIGLDKLPPLQPNQLFEITLEPSNGSQTGKPSGPILYIGRAVKVTS